MWAYEPWSFALYCRALKSQRLPANFSSLMTIFVKHYRNYPNYTLPKVVVLCRVTATIKSDPASWVAGNPGRLKGDHHNITPHPPGNTPMLGSLPPVLCI